jgi:pimeloyl-ACP methyl ester carboxylesterase
MAIEDLSGAADGAGILARGAGASIAYRRRSGTAALPGVVFLGGFRSDMTGTKATALDQFCAARGQAYLRFDYQGHGAASTGFEDGSIGLWLEDALAILDQLTEGPQILVGSSMGGWLMLLAALARPQRVAGLVGIAAATDFTESLIWARLPEEARVELVTAGRLVLPSAYDPMGTPITRRLIEEGRRHLLLDAPIPIERPVRLIHGMRDEDVPWRHSLALAEALTARDVTLTLVKEGDHRLSTPPDLARIEAAISALSPAR